jgi:hypothetical protein
VTYPNLCRHWQWKLRWRLLQERHSAWFHRLRSKNRHSHGHWRHWLQPGGTKYHMLESARQLRYGGCGEELADNISMNECGWKRVDEVEVSDLLELYIPSLDKGATPGRELEKDGRGEDENEMAQRKERYIPLPKIMTCAKYLTRTPFSHPRFHPCVVGPPKGVSKSTLAISFLASRCCHSFRVHS